jgi:hypothetical protein
LFESVLSEVENGPLPGLHPVIEAEAKAKKSEINKGERRARFWIRLEKGRDFD